MRYVPITRPELDFQTPPSRAEVQAFCDRLLGKGTVAEATELAGGMFNSTFLLTGGDRRWVLRISPKHDDPLLFANERHLMRREYGFQPYLSAAAPWLPKVVAIDFTTTVANRDASVTEFIEGRLWHDVGAEMTQAENDAIWGQLGRLLAAIHGTPTPFFGWTWPEPPFARWSDFLFEEVRGLLADYTRFGVDDTEPRAWFEAVQRGATVLDDFGAARMVHGDPWPRNLLISRDAPEIVGLLDHERAVFGDPMFEWVFHQMGFPRAFWDAYGPRPTGPAAEFRDEVYHGVIETQYILEGYRYRHEVGGTRARLAAGAARVPALLEATA